MQSRVFTGTMPKLHSPICCFLKDVSELKSLSLCIICHLRLSETWHLCHLCLPLKDVRFSKKKKKFSYINGDVFQCVNTKIAKVSQIVSPQRRLWFLTEWNFFATTHGKSLYGGIVGTVKRFVAHASPQAATPSHILTPRDMFQWTSQHITGIQFFYVSHNKIS